MNDPTGTVGFEDDALKVEVYPSIPERAYPPANNPHRKKNRT